MLHGLSPTICFSSFPSRATADHTHVVKTSTARGSFIRFFWKSFFQRDTLAAWKCLGTMFMELASILIILLYIFCGQSWSIKGCSCRFLNMCLCPGECPCDGGRWSCRPGQRSLFPWSAGKGVPNHVVWSPLLGCWREMVFGKGSDSHYEMEQEAMVLPFYPMSSACLLPMEKL